MVSFDMGVRPLLLLVSGWAGVEMVPAFCFASRLSIAALARVYPITSLSINCFLVKCLAVASMLAYVRLHPTMGQPTNQSDIERIQNRVRVVKHDRSC